MAEKSVASIIEKYNLIIPEMQREYVWGNKDTDILDLFFSDIKEKHENADQEVEQNLKEQLIQRINQGDFSAINSAEEESNRINSINIGFLYSYPTDISDENYIINDVYLIDGQQRFTTLFLSLFFFALKEDRKKYFTDIFRYKPEKEEIAFDYRVRSQTHNFVMDLLNNCDTLEDLVNIREKIWFLSDYADDATINSMINAIDKLHSLFAKEEPGYFDFLLHKVFFWHFDTKETSQGEELYITMNSRGKILAEYENIRAILFEQIKDTNSTRDWSERWEGWQDFFWRHRKENPDADDGFNEFLKCIAGFENFLNDKGEFYSSDEFQIGGIKISSLEQNLSLNIILKYFEAYTLLFNKKEQFKKEYNYSKWIDKCLDELENLLNNEQTNWFLNYDKDTRTVGPRRMYYVWSLLYYLSSIEDPQCADIDEIFRILRLFYVRYHNSIRSVSSIKENIEEIRNSGVWNVNSKYSYNDEIQKHQFLLNFEQLQIKRFEEEIWELEDHPHNLDAGGLRNINITHLVDFSTIESLKDIKLIKNKFFELFPLTQWGKPITVMDLKTILLYFGQYWQKKPPNYYKNYYCGEWKRIIRDIDNKENTFKRFFKEFISKSFSDLKEELICKFVADFKNKIIPATEILPAMDLRYELIIYSLLTDIWTRGDYIAIHDPVENESRLFEDEHNQICNTQGNFHGKIGNIDLWEKANQEIGRSLENASAAILIEHLKSKLDLQ